MLHWALTAAAVLMLLFAIRTLFVSARDEEGKGTRPGCFFALFAALLWIYVLNHYFGDISGAVRIGVGVLLALPAVRAVAQPKGANILFAVVGLMLAVLIAGGPIVELSRDLGPDPRPEDVQEAEQRIAELEELRDELSLRRDGLEGLRYELKAELSGSGEDWDGIAADPHLLGQLKVLQRVEEEHARVEAGIASIDERLPELRERLEKVSAQGQSESEFDAWIEALRTPPAESDLSLVEEHAQKQELKELFEREVKE